jgi:eukaryotic-like serine/threonine-protein kinase
MYLSSNAGGMFHLWRQRFPDGEVEQLTHGPTEEEGIAVAVDGRSLVTSAGVRHNAIWLLENEQERQISVEAYAFSPVATRDGELVYFLSRDGASRLAYNIGRLVAVSLASGAREELLPGYSLVHFDLSADDRQVVFVAGTDEAARRGIWVAMLDGSAAPRRIYDGDTERVLFDPAGHVYFLQRSGSARYLHRLRAPDYRVNERVYEERVWYLFGASPGGDWIAAVGLMPDSDQPQHIAVSTRGAPARVLCGFCGGGAGPARVLAPGISWTRDGRALLVSAQFTARGYGMSHSRFTIVVPLQPEAPLPELPAAGIASIDDYLGLPGARRINHANVLPGASPNRLLYYETTTIRNLYRVDLQ